MPRVGHKVLGRSLQIEVTLQHVLAAGLDVVRVQGPLEPRGRDAILLVQLFWDVEDGLWLQIQELPGREISESLQAALTRPDAEGRGNEPQGTVGVFHGFADG